MKIKHKEIEVVLWTFILSILFFQSILQAYSLVSNIALFLIAISQFIRMNGSQKVFLCVIIFWLLSNVSYSVLCYNNISYSIRFGMIIFFVLSAYLWRTDYHLFFKSLFGVSLLLVISLICLEIYMFTLSESEYMILRDHFFKINDMGDVFWWGVYYKLELRGTPLIVFVYMLSYVTEIFPQKHKVLFRFLYFVATICAGNFAYQLALVFFHMAYYVLDSLSHPKLFLRRMLRLCIVFLFLGGSFLAYISSQMETKKEGSAQTRVDQAEALYNDMSQNPITLLFGTGLGHTIEVNSNIRDYRGATYFELQTLYIFNQLGLLNFTILVLLNIFLAFRYIKRKELLLIYGVYVTYAFTNPYIWDTNHVVVISSLLCAKAQIFSHNQNLLGYLKQVKVICNRNG